METKIEKNLFKGKKNRCFIVGTGSSLNNIDMSLLKDEIVIGINLILLKKDLSPDYVVLSDTTVIRRHYDDIFNDRIGKGTYVLNNGCTMTGKGNCTSSPGCTCFPVDIDPKYNTHTLLHKEHSGIHINHMNNDKTKLLKTDQYYMDPELNYHSTYGGSTVDNLAIPLAVYLGFKEIYLLGCDAGYDHFYDSSSSKKYRDWINYSHVLNILNPKNIKLKNCDPTNRFKELEYINLNNLIK